jgi:hypothetical protein
VDGYTYAIPLCAVFRRNTDPWNGDPSQNLNGGFNRNPTATDRTGYKTFSTMPTLAADMNATQLTATLVSAANLPMPTSPLTDVLIQIDDEILSYSVITGTILTLTSPRGLGNGLDGTRAEAHKAGAVIKVLSGRPDGLYSDQIAKTDIYDLRHAVNPNGFDYQALLKGNLDRLLRGQLRSNWKRSGTGGIQGPVICYQDKIGSAAATGITKLDAPDGIRQVFGDPAMLQPVVIPIGAPASGSLSPINIGGTLGNAYTVTVNHPSSAGFQVGDVITVPKSQFVTGLPGGDTDQVELLANQTYVTIRFMGETSDLALAQYSVANNVGGDLEITFTGSFSPRGATNPGTVQRGAFITLCIQYGPGRGLSRRPDSVHSVAYLNGSPELALRLTGVDSDNQELSTAWAPLWSKFRSAMYNGLLPQTAEALVDPGSKTVILTPFRHQGWSFAPSQFVTIQKWVNGMTPALNATNGAMPSYTPLGVPKAWGASDPLGIFSGYGDPTSAQANMVVVIPRKFMPGWGAVHAPILWQDAGNNPQGINFGVFAPTGTPPNSMSNYVPISGMGGLTYAVFSTSISYNTLNGSFVGSPAAGMRKFTDSRNLGRQGLELPPFYICARVMGVYELQDYLDNNSPFNPTTRVFSSPGNAKNLLRQDFKGPTLFIEQDVDGDPTCIINADAIDITKSPNPISNFASGSFVVEASIFGADRNAFDLGQDCRIVLARGRSEGLTASTSIPSSPNFVLPGAPMVGDDIVVNYSREVYQGTAFSNQTSQMDIGQQLGPMLTADRYQLLTTTLDYDGLLRPNQKVLEVLAGMAFQTTLGSGLIAGDSTLNDADFRNVGYEPWTVPTTSTDPRPAIIPGALVTAEKVLTVGSEFLGCVERLPMPALFRSKDFRGNAIGGATGQDFRQLATGLAYGPLTVFSGLNDGVNSEFDVAPVHGNSTASGNAGEIVVHVDGSADLNQTTVYRTNRGGSCFTASGDFPGGDVGGILPTSQPATTSGGVLSGIAMLVRTTPITVGATEQSAGQEIAMLVCTTARPQSAAASLNTVQCNTSGTGESFSAADLFRISGHPLTTDAQRPLVDPSTIVLARKSDLLP